MSLRKEDEPASSLTLETLLAEGGIENLVNEQRVPNFISVSEKYKTSYACFVPPEGTRFGDSREGSAMIGYSFFHQKES